MPPPKPPQTPLQALRQIGYFQNVDYIIVALLLAVWVLSPVWNYVSGFEVFNQEHVVKVNFYALGLATGLLLLVWLVILAYRCMYFVVQLTASVKLMPLEAARILAARTEVSSSAPSAPPS